MARLSLAFALCGVIASTSTNALAQAGPGGGDGALTIPVPTGTPGAAPGPGGASISVYQTPPAPAPSGPSTVGVNDHLDSSSRVSTNAARSTDTFDFGRPNASGTVVRGTESSSYIVSGQYVPELHTVIRGDTLWEISDKYYANPYNWPRIWALNAQVQNPHWLYPGDHIRLRGPSVRQAALAGFVRQRPLVSPDTEFVRHTGMIRDAKIAEWGMVIGSPDDQMLLSAGDDIYIEIEEDRRVELGQLLTIFEPRKVENLDDSEFVWIRGIAKVNRVNPNTNMVRARIVEALDTIERGALVGPMDRKVDVVAPKRNKTTIRARIVGALYPHEFYEKGQTVFIDKGFEEGVEVGNRFFAVTRGDEWRLRLKSAGNMADVRAITEDDRVAQVEPTPDTDQPENYPSETYAELMVTRVREHSAVCTITASVHEIPRGALVIAREGY